MDNKPLHRLIGAARKARPSPAPFLDLDPPIGFATRVAAFWSARPEEKTILFERIAWRGLVCAVLVCTATALARRSAASFDSVANVESIEIVDDELEFF